MSVLNIFRKKSNREVAEKEINPYKLEVPSCSGNRYVVGDIHGCLETFKALIIKINITPKDQLFLLGDYVDRGQHPKEIIDYIIELQSDFQVFPLKGNHEEDLLLLARLNKKRLIKNYIKSEPYNLFEQDFTIKKKYLDFLNSLPYFAELENDFLVHAGFDFSQDNPFTAIDEMVWIRDFENDKKFTKGKRIIHGHSIFELDEIVQKIKNKASIIPIDGGAVVADVEEFGNLVCYNITKNELIVQKNIEKVKYCVNQGNL